MGVAGRADTHAVEQGEVLRGVHCNRVLQAGEGEDLLSRDAAGTPSLSEQQAAVGSPAHDGALSPACLAEENRGLGEVFQAASGAEVDDEGLLGWRPGAW